MSEPATALLATLGLCAGVALVFLPPVTAARLFAKDKCLEPMFGDDGQARTKAAILILMIDTTSSHTCTKPIVVRSLFVLLHILLDVAFDCVVDLHFVFYVCFVFHKIVSEGIITAF